MKSSWTGEISGALSQVYRSNFEDCSSKPQLHKAQMQNQRFPNTDLRLYIISILYAYIMKFLKTKAISKW